MTKSSSIGKLSTQSHKNESSRSCIYHATFGVWFNSIWAALTEEEMDVIYDKADFETGYRCFNWPHCVDSNSCTRISDERDLAELLETCLNDSECVAVSCEGFTSINGGHCTRSMLSGYCDEYTKDDEDNWLIVSGTK